ncbi:MAG: DUF5666 domain-containing protein [Ktedonobacterales bacterium]
MDDFVDAAPNWQNQYPPPPRRSSWSKWLLLGGVALALLLTLGVGVLLGSHIGTAQAASVASSGTSSQGANFVPGGPISFHSSGETLASTPGSLGGPQGQCERLTVTSVSGSTITGKAADGSTVTVHTTATTQYSRNGQSVSASAVTVGSTISVMGTHNSDGSITATSIIVG